MTWHIVTCEYPPRVGGVSHYTRAIAVELARAGHDVHVWCPPPGDQEHVPGVCVHPALGRFRPEDLRRVGRQLDGFGAPRRLLVQWVPHGFGYHSMNVWFCLWLAARSLRGDRVDLMVHEPFLDLRGGALRHRVMAVVHRLMTVVILAAAARVWVSIPAWERALRPYTLGRRIAVEWLPIAVSPRLESVASTGAVRQRYVRPSEALIGHFGAYGTQITTMLEERLPLILDGIPNVSLLLVGEGSERFREALIDLRAEWSTRVYATGWVPPDRLDETLACCDVFVQPYPDGITSRRTSAMACLAIGGPLVTTAGHLTEPLWAESGAARLVDVEDHLGFVEATRSLVENPAERTRLGMTARSLIGERFALAHTVTTLVA